VFCLAGYFVHLFELMGVRSKRRRLNLGVSKKLVKKVKVRIPWVSHVVNDADSALDINPDPHPAISAQSDTVEGRVPWGSRCPLCRGTKFLCGRTRCPVITRFYGLVRARRSLTGTTVDGSSPPSVFVGRIGYPYVYAGPVVPPIHGDTGIYDSPELWFGSHSIKDIVDYRLNLVRGKFRVDVRLADPNKMAIDAGRLLQETQELSLASRAVDAEMVLKRPPNRDLILGPDIQPMGFSALIKRFYTNSNHTDVRLDRAFGDTDLLAKEAMVSLHHHGVPVNRIQRALSTGCFGVDKQRRLVPTRWSITAVDSTVSIHLREKVKQYPLLSDIQVHETNYLDNRFLIILLPEAWSYELVEAWYPGTTWNPDRRNIAVGSDWEGFRGRTKYARIGGCYYASRLAVAEHLTQERRQATALVLRESYPGFTLPLGVWLVRECVRNALENPAIKFNTFQEAMEHVKARMKIPLPYWVKSSTLLDHSINQAKLTDYFYN
jgi:hypothetical protein